MKRIDPSHAFPAEKPVVGMIHLRPLPGSPAWEGSMEAILDRALTDARLLEEGGVDGLLVENFGDIPFEAGPVAAETVAAVTRAVSAVVAATTLPVGVNVLRNDARAALGAAVAAGALFIRVNVHAGVMFTDQGTVEGRAHETVRVRRLLDADVAILADVHVKHAAPPPGVGIGEAARDLWHRGRADGLVVSGTGTGRPVDRERAVRVRKAVPEAPLWIGSGVTPANVADLLTLCDGLIVGSAGPPGQEIRVHEEVRKGRTPLAVELELVVELAHVAAVGQPPLGRARLPQVRGVQQDLSAGCQKPLQGPEERSEPRQRPRHPAPAHEEEGGPEFLRRLEVVNAPLLDPLHPPLPEDDGRLGQGLESRDLESPLLECEGVGTGAGPHVQDRSPGLVEGPPLPGLHLVQAPEEDRDRHLLHDPVLPAHLQHRVPAAPMKGEDGTTQGPPAPGRLLISFHVMPEESPRSDRPTRPNDPVQLDARRAAVMLLRALRRRCPNCGGGPLFSRWIRMRDTCPRCHLKLDRGEHDYFLGSYTVNFVAAELFVAAAALAAILLTWPDVPWKAVEYGLYAVVIPFPILTYPFSKTLWLAVDLWFRPLTLSDLAGHGENVTDDALFHRSGSSDPP